MTDEDQPIHQPGSQKGEMLLILLFTLVRDACRSAMEQQVTTRCQWCNEFRSDDKLAVLRHVTTCPANPVVGELHRVKAELDHAKQELRKKKSRSKKKKARRK